MQEAEEQDTCRICSAPAEPDQPLFHPCKCSGTIRYIHQDCLTTWLAHSKKKTCDVCKHPYSFTKVYAPDMPSRLPAVLLLRRLAQQAFFMLLFVVRALSVAIIWLAVLPWATVWTWRMYFTMGESTAWWISNRTRTTESEESLNPFYINVPNTSTVPSSQPLLLYAITSHPTWIALSADIFTGQIIASVLVLTFIAVFLLREWISQNARPGVFDDEEGPGEERAPDQVVAPPRAAPPRPRVLDETEAARLARRQLEAMQALDALRAREGTHGHLVGEGRNHGRTALDVAPVPVGKVSATGEETDRFAMARARRRHERTLSENKNSQNNEEEQSLRRRSLIRRKPRRKDQPPPTLAERAAQSSFEFTFRAETPLSRATRSTPHLTGELSFRERSVSSEAPGSIFPSVQLEPPRGSIPFSLTPFTPDSSPPAGPGPAPPPLSSPPSPLLDSPSSGEELLHPSQPSSPIRRPPLPPAIPLSTGSSPTTPLDSPSLATYRAPEDLDDQPLAGPSDYDGYFDGEYEDDDLFDDDEALAEERDRYFAEVKQEPGSSPPLLDSSSRRKSDDEEEEEEDDEDDANWEGLNLDDDDADAEELGEPALVDAVVAAAAAPQPAILPGAQMPLAQAAAALRQAADQVGQEPAAAEAPELNEENEGNVEDDMEGAMEAIGMRGPIYGVLQNAALMVFVLDTAIGLGVWIPFTIGKSTALLTLDPPRLFQIIHLPIRAIRIITDPIVDAVVYMFVEFFLPPYIRLAHTIANFFAQLTLVGIGRFLGTDSARKASELGVSAYSHAVEIIQNPMQFISSLTTKSTTLSPTTNGTGWFDAQVNTLVTTAEPYFAIFGKFLRLSFIRFKEVYVELALGSDTRDKIFAVFYGYLVASLALALYLNILNLSNVKNTGRAIRNVVRQQILVMKVAAFIFIELVIFPLSCGVVLDLTTIWLFRELTLAERATFVAQAPLTAMFYHWVAGTMFMYCFAVLLAASRGLLRPGAMWFVRDPQDQNSHPIRDILDRPTFVQLRKICISGMMYAVVVMLVVLSVGALLVLGKKSVMPIRWKTREPLSNVPIDLLFLHLVLPYTMHYFRPRKTLKKIALATWKFVAHQLRLSSYFFGERVPDEETALKGWNIFNSDAERVKTGSFRRVPATDHIALPRDMRATAPVTETGEPVDDAARQLMTRQNTEVIKAKREVAKDYIIAYIPPRFVFRVVAFISCMWTFGAISLGLSMALPILIGRRFFRLFLPYDVHDGYSFIVGFYLLWGCFIVAKAIDRLDKRRQRRGTEGPRADLRILVLKRGFLWIAKIAYMVLFLGLVIPILISFVVDLYVVLPIRFVTEPNLVPRIRVVDSWALGLLYVKIGLYVHKIQAQRQPQNPHPIFNGIQQIIRNGWTRPEPVNATKDVIAPLVGGLVAMILVPGLAFTTIRYLAPVLPLNNKFLFTRVYPSIFTAASLSRSSVVLAEVLTKWSQSVRDTEFLVEMRLRNHDPDSIKTEELTRTIKQEEEENRAVLQ